MFSHAGSSPHDGSRCFALPLRSLPNSSPALEVGPRRRQTSCRAMPLNKGSQRTAVADFVRWTRRNRALLLLRARQSPLAKGTCRSPPAKALLSCLRQTCSRVERRYYNMLRALIVERYRALCREETLLLGEAWSSVLTALRTGLEGADATPSATTGAGVLVRGAGCELCAHAAAMGATALAACVPEHAMPKRDRASLRCLGLHEHRLRVRPGVVDFVQWAYRNHASLSQRARQGPPCRSRLHAKGTPAANLLGCLRRHHSIDERRYYDMLYFIVVGQCRAFCGEEALLLGEVWSSVSTALHADPEDAGAALLVTLGAGASVPGAGRGLGDHAAALCATAPAASIPGRATPKKACASAPGMGLRRHASPRRAHLVKATPARCGKKRRTTREP
jgi:hypothetical protein